MDVRSPNASGPWLAPDKPPGQDELHTTSDGENDCD